MQIFNFLQCLSLIPKLYLYFCKARRNGRETCNLRLSRMLLNFVMKCTNVFSEVNFVLSETQLCILGLPVSP